MSSHENAALVEMFHEFAEPLSNIRSSSRSHASGATAIT